MMATVPHVTSASGHRIFQADGFLLDGVYIQNAATGCDDFQNAVLTNRFE